MDSHLGSIVAAHYIQERMTEAGAARARSEVKRTRRHAPKPPGARRRRLLGRFA